LNFDDRLKLNLQKTEDEVQFVRQMRKQLLLQKKSAAEEEAEARKYLQLREQYVHILLYFYLFIYSFLSILFIYIKFFAEIILCMLVS